MVPTRSLACLKVSEKDPSSPSGARFFKITYKGGDGNDIVLTVLVGDRLPPTDISLSNITIAENSSDGALVGSLSTRDPDANDAFTYSLIDISSGERFFVEYNDYDGPHWTGVIDTSTDKLTINGWTVNPGQFLSSSVLTPGCLACSQACLPSVSASNPVFLVCDRASGYLRRLEWRHVPRSIVFWVGGVGSFGGRTTTVAGEQDTGRIKASRTLKPVKWVFYGQRTKLQEWHLRKRCRLATDVLTIIRVEQIHPCSASSAISLS